MSDQIERPADAADPTYPDAERCAQTLENCEDDLLTEAQFVRWQGQEIERLTAALQHEADCVEAAKEEIERLTAENGRQRADLLAGRNVVNAGLTIHTLTIERDMLRQKIERLTAALRADCEARNQKLRAACTALAALVQRDRVALYEAHHYPHSGEVDAAGQAGLDEYDAALAQADQAMGSE